MVKNNRSKKQAKMINGIKVYQKAGTWYCDFAYYAKRREQQGKPASIDGFVRWCEDRDLSPTG